ncbi:MAG: hypothetical protein SGILL_004073 [Bacillariaceae sp.]
MNQFKASITAVAEDRKLSPDLLSMLLIDLHHLDQSTKSFSVSSATTIAEAQEEAKKCQALCCMCHRSVTTAEWHTVSWVAMDAHGNVLNVVFAGSPERNGFEWSLDMF